MAGEGRRRQRLFFALWPDAGVRDALAELAARLPARTVAPDNLHITLAFVGLRTAEERDCMERAAAAVEEASFSLVLDYLGAFPKNQAQWVGTQHTPGALKRLVDALGTALLPCGVERETRRFTPHVTLARHVKNPIFQSIDEPIEWKIGEFVLAQSLQDDAGVYYKIISRWALG
jgi:2'-5' RNA ligase